MIERQLHILHSMAILLGSALLFVGCVDVVEVEEVGEDIQGSTKVDVAMALNSDYENGAPQTRMTAGTVQKQGEPIQALNQMKFYATTDPKIGGKFTQDVTAKSEWIPLTMNNTTFVANQHVSARAFFEKEVALPIGTNRFVGFGSVSRPFGPVGPVQNSELFENGTLISHWNLQSDFDAKVSTLGDFYFGPRSIRVKTLNSAEEKAACRMLRLINRPMEVKVEIDGKQMSWGDVMRTGEETYLKTTYEEYVGNKAGAYKNIKSLLESVYYQLGEAINNPDYLEKYKNLAKAIRARILDPETTKKVVDGVEYVDDISFTAQTDGNEVVFTEKNTALQGFDFPSQLDLPDGATTLVYHSGQVGDVWPTANEAFPYIRFNENDASGNVGLPLYSYAFPAELIYRVDSPVKASNEVHEGEWSSSSIPWNDFVTANYQDDKLTATSKSLVLEEPLHYMVGCLETRAYVEGTQLQDGSNPAKTITVKDGGFPVVGVLIGMQNYVGWNGCVRQTPIQAQFPDLQYIYYDKHLATPGAIGTTKVSNVTKDNPITYSLVLQSAVADFAKLKDQEWGAAEGQRTKQMILLELENNTGMDFHGHNKQRIAKGTHFYLMGELNLREEYEKDIKRLGNEQKFKDANKAYSVFEQGVTTTVTLRIHSLAGAYNCIPDLRNPSLKISLKTDWNWHNGLIFDDNFEINEHSP